MWAPGFVKLSEQIVSSRQENTIFQLIFTQPGTHHLKHPCTDLCDDRDERLSLLEEHLDHLRLVGLRRKVDGLLTEVICVVANYICEFHDH